MNRLLLSVALGVTAASCADGSVIGDPEVGGDTGSVDGVVGDATADGPQSDTASGLDGSDGGLCPTEQPVPDAPCSFPGLRCESKCSGVGPDDRYWTAECVRGLDIWSVTGHPARRSSGSEGICETKLEASV